MCAAVALPPEFMHLAKVYQINHMDVCDVQQVAHSGVCTHTHAQMASILGVTVSSLCLVLLNVDKLIFFRKPLHYAQLVTPFR